jgi:choline dehydrogenase-like flavoprotein
MDQPALPILVQCRKPVDKTLIDIAAVTDHIHFEQVSGGDIATMLAPVVGALLPARDRTPKRLARVERMFKLLTQKMRDSMNQAIMLIAILKNPMSEGSVRLTSGDPQANLEIDNAKFHHAAEHDVMIGALRVLKKVAETSPMKEIRKDMLNGPSRFLQIQFAKLYASFIRIPIARYYANTAVTFPPLPDLDFSEHEPQKKNKAIEWLNKMTIEGWHYTGTCQFGKVVDEDFKVIGAEGLRVVDASVLRRPPTINPQATLMMLGDYAGRVSIAPDKQRQLQGTIADR